VQLPLSETRDRYRSVRGKKRNDPSGPTKETAVRVFLVGVGFALLADLLVDLLGLSCEIRILCPICSIRNTQIGDFLPEEGELPLGGALSLHVYAPRGSL
jgi:hypothetical protein